MQQVIEGGDRGTDGFLEDGLEEETRCPRRAGIKQGESGILASAFIRLGKGEQ